MPLPKDASHIFTQGYQSAIASHGTVYYNPYRDEQGREWMRGVDQGLADKRLLNAVQEASYGHRFTDLQAVIKEYKAVNEHLRARIRELETRLEEEKALRVDIVREKNAMYGELNSARDRANGSGDLKTKLDAAQAVVQGQMKEISDLVRENQKLDLRVKDLEANQSLDLKTRKELIALNEQVAYLRRQRDYAEKVLGEVRRALDL